MQFFTKGKRLLNKQIEDIFPHPNCFHHDLYYITFYLKEQQIGKTKTL